MALMDALFANSGSKTPIPPAKVGSAAPTPPNAKHFIRNGFVNLSASQMAVILRQCTHPIQLEVRNPETQAAQQHIDVLADMMKRETWRQPSPIDFALLGSDLWMVNGCHRGHAQVHAGKSLEWAIVIHKVDTEEDLRRLFYTFDTNTRSRSTKQVLTATGFAVSKGLSKGMAGALYRAIPFITHNFDMNKVTRDYVFSRNMDRRIDVMTAWTKPAQMYDDCLVEARPLAFKGRLMRGGCTAIALVTLKYQPEAALEFWKGVAENDGLRTGDPRRALVQDLLTRQVGTGVQLQSCAAPALAWNSYFKNEKRKIIKVYENHRVTIEGTPFDGSRK